MTASFVRNSLDMRCTITRDTSLRANPFGGPAGGFPREVIAVNVPCRIWEASASLIENGTLNLQLTQFKGRFPIDTDLQLKDRVDFVDAGIAYSIEITTVLGEAEGFGHVIATGRTVG